MSDCSKSLPIYPDDDQASSRPVIKPGEEMQCCIQQMVISRKPELAEALGKSRKTYGRRSSPLKQRRSC